MKNVTNLWQLMQAECSRNALLRACGVCEDTIQNGSDYDRFAAYADCMLLCRGHEILHADAALIEKLLGVAVPICPGTAPDLWHAAAFALTGLGEQPATPEVCEIPFAALAEQTLCCADVGQAFYAAPTAELMMRLVSASVQAICVTAQIESFVKPNPYTARRLSLQASEDLTPSERDLLTAQTLRVLGKLCAERGSDLYVQSDFAATDAWRALLAYLQQSGCLSRIVLTVQNADALRAATTLVACLPNPSDVPTIRVGIANVPERDELLDLYATLLPIGVLPPEI